nr:cardiolipin synthase [Desulfuromonadales bacterium]
MLDLILGGILFALAVFSAVHALLSKRDPRAALGWLVVCFALPGVGVLIYWLFGVNRIRTRARNWQEGGRGIPKLTPESHHIHEARDPSAPIMAENFAGLLNLVNCVTRRPLVPGNFVQPLHNGEEAYPAMIKAIEAASSRICLSTYIFESNETGRRFATALIEAAQRGVEVRVLIDALGDRYTLPSIRRYFKKTPVRIERFLPPSLMGRGIFFNLRNHRKILVVDGRQGFVGGMNIGDRHLADNQRNKRRVIDIHFAIEGPVVGHLEDAFNEDWTFTTGEEVPDRPEVQPEGTGNALARGISAGPNEDFEKLYWILIGALNSARRNVRIMTPYFIPDRALVSAINAAALRGVEVDILLPGKNNLPYVGWAMDSYLWEMLQYKTSVYYLPPPFV